MIENFYQSGEAGWLPHKMFDGNKSRIVFLRIFVNPPFKCLGSKLEPQWSVLLDWIYAAGESPTDHYHFLLTSSGLPGNRRWKLNRAQRAPGRQNSTSKCKCELFTLEATFLTFICVILYEIRVSMWFCIQARCSGKVSYSFCLFVCFFRISGKWLPFAASEDQGFHHSMSQWAYGYLKELEASGSCKLTGKLLRRSVLNRRNEGRA